MAGPLLAAGLSAGGKIISGLIGRGTANKVAKNLTSSTNEGIQSLFSAYNQSNGRLAPYLSGGNAAYQNLLSFAGINPAVGRADPYGRVVGQVDYASYVLNNPDIKAAFENMSDKDRQYIRKLGYSSDPEGYGRYIWETYGPRDGHQAPTAYQGPDANLSPEEQAAQSQKAASDLLSFIQSSPGYAARSSAMNEAVNQSNTARGLGISGANVLDEATVQGNLVNDEFNRLIGLNTGISQTGAQATNTAIGLDSNLGSNLYDANQELGQIRAGKVAGRRGAVEGAITGALDSLLAGAGDAGIFDAIGGGANAVGGGGIGGDAWPFWRTPPYVQPITGFGG